MIFLLGLILGFSSVIQAETIDCTDSKGLQAYVLLHPPYTADRIYDVGGALGLKLGKCFFQTLPSEVKNGVVFLLHDGKSYEIGKIRKRNGSGNRTEGTGYVPLTWTRDYTILKATQKIRTVVETWDEGNGDEGEYELTERVSTLVLQDPKSLDKITLKQNSLKMPHHSMASFTCRMKEETLQDKKYFEVRIGDLVLGYFPEKEYAEHFLSLLEQNQECQFSRD